MQNDLLPSSPTLYPQAFFLGPPTPPCEPERQRTHDALQLLERKPDPEISSILKLAGSIFQAPAVIVALFDTKRVFISDSLGPIPEGNFPWRWTLCAWSLAYQNPQILVVPDTLKDQRWEAVIFKRFKGSPKYIDSGPEQQHQTLFNFVSARFPQRVIQSFRHLVGFCLSDSGH